MFAFTFQVKQSPASLPNHEQHEEQSQASLPTHVQLNFLTTQPNYAYRANNVGYFIIAHCSLSSDCFVFLIIDASFR